MIANTPLILLNFGSIKRMLAIMEDALARTQRDVEKKLKRYPDDEGLNSELDDIGSVLTPAVRRSWCITCHSVFEKCLMELAEDARKIRGVELSVKDICAGSFLEKYKKFFKKVIKISFPDQTRVWKDVQNCSHIRNVFAHADGDLAGQKNSVKEAKRFMKDYPRYFDKDESEIKPNKKYCEFALKTYEEFISALAEELRSSRVSKDS